MRAVAYEVTLYPRDSVIPEVRLFTFMDMRTDQPEVPCKMLYVHIDPKPKPLPKVATS